MKPSIRAASQPSNRTKHIPHIRLPKRASRAPIHAAQFHNDLAARRAWVQNPVADAAYALAMRNGDQRKAWPTRVLLERKLRILSAEGVTREYIDVGAMFLALDQWDRLSDLEPMTSEAGKEFDDEADRYVPIGDPESAFRIEPTLDFIAEKMTSPPNEWLRAARDWEGELRYQFRRGSWQYPTLNYQMRDKFKGCPKSAEIPGTLPETCFSTFEDRLIRQLDFEALRTRLGAETVSILDMAISSATMTEIGVSLGQSREYARREGGKQQVFKALRKLSELIFEKHPLFRALNA